MRSMTSIAEGLDPAVFVAVEEIFIQTIPKSCFRKPTACSTRRAAARKRDLTATPAWLHDMVERSRAMGVARAAYESARF